MRTSHSDYGEESKLAKRRPSKTSSTYSFTYLRKQRYGLSNRIGEGTIEVGIGVAIEDDSVVYLLRNTRHGACERAQRIEKDRGSKA